jgi:hypothetical protein
MANAVFMNYDVRPNLQDIIDGKAHSPIAYVTAAKERIRWLSRALERALGEAPPEKEKAGIMQQLTKNEVAELNRRYFEHTIVSARDLIEAVQVKLIEKNSRNSPSGASEQPRFKRIGEIEVSLGSVNFWADNSEQLILDMPVGEYPVYIDAKHCEIAK